MARMSARWCPYVTRTYSATLDPSTWTMTKPFEHNGRTYTFERHRGCVKPIRDDGCTMWSTYPTLPVGEYYAHLPAFATVTEAQAAIMGQPQPTYIHVPVWAHSADEAARIRKEMSDGR